MKELEYKESFPAVFCLFSVIYDFVLGAAIHQWTSASGDTQLSDSVLREERERERESGGGKPGPGSHQGEYSAKYEPKNGCFILNIAN